MFPGTQPLFFSQGVLNKWREEGGSCTRRRATKEHQGVVVGGVVVEGVDAAPEATTGAGRRGIVDTGRGGIVYAGAGAAATGAAAAVPISPSASSAVAAGSSSAPTVRWLAALVNALRAMLRPPRLVVDSG